MTNGFYQSNAALSMEEQGSKFDLYQFPFEGPMDKTDSNANNAFGVKHKDFQRQTSEDKMGSVLCSCGNGEPPSISKFLTSFLCKGDQNEDEKDDILTNGFYESSAALSMEEQGSKFDLYQFPFEGPMDKTDSNANNACFWC